MDNQTYVINGVTGSIGTALANLICSKGGSVIGIGRDQVALTKLKESLTSFTPFQIEDVSNSEEASMFLEEIRANHSNTIASYIHLAGTFVRETDPISSETDIWNATLSTNLTGTYIWNKTLIDYFTKSGIRGSIVNTSSQAAYTGGFGPNFSYAASKGGVISLSKSLSRYCAPFNIRVNVVVPGFVENEMMLKGLTLEQKDFFVGKTTLGRLASDSEVAKACLFLASTESEYSTGIVLDVTGGLLDV